MRTRTLIRFMVAQAIKHPRPGHSRAGLFRWVIAKAIFPESIEDF